MGRVPKIAGHYKCVACREHRPVAEFLPRVSGKVSAGEQLRCAGCRAAPRKGRGRAQVFVEGRSFPGVWHYVQWKKTGRPCADCRQTFHPIAMDFDHVRGEKKFNLSGAGANLAAVQEELEKCEVVCSNCHRVRSHNRQTQNLKNPAPFGPILGTHVAA